MIRAKPSSIETFAAMSVVLFTTTFVAVAQAGEGAVSVMVASKNPTKDVADNMKQIRLDRLGPPPVGPCPGQLDQKPPEDAEQSGSGARIGRAYAAKEPPESKPPTGTGRDAVERYEAAHPPVDQPPNGTGRDATKEDEAIRGPEARQPTGTGRDAAYTQPDKTRPENAKSSTKNRPC